ncbi:MAG: hypothetical protein IJV93_00760 [Lentisphaeria bacterium]|nr:hypothetical protein [Lentisphaeria bacterium]
MFESWFTQKCTAFVNSSGTALAGDELSAAENAVKNAELEDLKIWTDNDGVYYTRKRSLFASAETLRDANGNPVRICNHKVNNNAHFCSKCGTPAPGGWWKCSGCGQMIGNDSSTCPHCGKAHVISARQHLSDGYWQKNEDILAEFIDLEDVTLKMDNGLNVQPHQCCVFFAGGKMVEILAPGAYSDEQLKEMAAPYGGNRSIVMIDKAEFPVRMCVEKLHSKENIETDLHISLTLRLDELNINLFLQNFMGNGLTLGRGKFSNVVVYDEIARTMLQFTDLLAREYCASRTIKEFFCDSSVRKELEDYLAKELFDHLKSAGMSLVRLGEIEFESEVFDELRKRSGELEIKRKELEFMEKVRELENAEQRKEQEFSEKVRELENAVKRKDLENAAYGKELEDEARRQEINRENTMADFLRETAKDKKIKEQLFEEEMAHLQKSWRLKQEISDLEYKFDIEDAALQRSNQSRLQQLRMEWERQKYLHDQKLQQRKMEQEWRLDEVNFDDQLTGIVQALELKKQAHAFQLKENETAHSQKIEKQTADHQIGISEKKLDSQLHSNEAVAENRSKIRKIERFTDDEIRHHAAETDIDIHKKSGLTELELESERRKLELDVKAREAQIELDRLERLVKLKGLKRAAAQQSTIELLQAAQGADIASLLMVTDDPAKRAQLLKLYEQNKWEGMSVEQILATGVLQGNRDAVSVLETLSKNKKNENSDQ